MLYAITLDIVPGYICDAEANLEYICVAKFPICALFQVGIVQEMIMLMFTTSSIACF